MIFIDPCSFGASPETSPSKNVEAFQAAINHATLSKNALIIPGGTFSLDARLKWSGGLTMTGSGVGQSTLSWVSGCKTSGLSGNLVDSFDCVTIRDLTLERYGFRANTNAISINGSAQILSGNIQDRFSPRLLLEDVYIRGNDVWSDGWDCGIDMVSVINASITRSYIVGKLNGSTSNYHSALGIKTSGLGNPCVLTIDQPFIMCTTSAIISEDVEGLLILSPTIVSVQNGIIANNSNPLDLQPQVVVSNGHINQSGAGIILDSSWAATITGNQISGISDTPRDTSGIIIRGSSKAFNITNNTFENTSATFGMTGVAVEDGTAGFIDNNVFANQEVAMWLTSGASKVRVGGGNINSENPLGGNATWVVNQGTDSEIATKTYTKSIVFTLSGGFATEFVQVPIPAKIFSAKPSYASLVDASGTQFLVTIYDHDDASNTATNCRFILRRADGVNITAGAHRLAFTASGY